MKTIMCAMAALASLALTSALYGYSFDLGHVTEGASIQVNISGDWDGGFSVINTDTNEEVAGGSFLVNFNWSGTPYNAYGWSNSPTVTADVGGDIGKISGLPEGNYRVELETPNWINTYSYTSGNSIYWYGGYNYIIYDVNVQ